MVVDLLSDDKADRIFHALADTTRRDILRRTLVGEHNVSALARTYAMSFAAVQKHVVVLEQAGLVAKHRHGRETLVRAEVDTLRRTARLLDEFEALWRARIDQIGELLADDPEGGIP
jgi:DNA-binding transcriptional ArsR family regulator